MSRLEGLPTKTLQLLWDNIHKEEGLIAGELTDCEGRHCALGATFDVPVDCFIGNVSGMEDRALDLGFTIVDGGYTGAWAVIVKENNGFEGSLAERRIHMLQFLGSELMSRKDLEVGFKNKIETVAA